MGFFFIEILDAKHDDELAGPNSFALSTFVISIIIILVQVFFSFKKKWSLISKARTISQTKDGLQNIYVNPDLTKTERNNQYMLRQEVRARRQHGEKVKISKGKVIQIPS